MTAEVTRPITSDEAIARVVESAERMGVELGEGEAAEWIAAMAAEVKGGDVVLDVNTGVYGHRVTMLDFKPEDLAHFRKIAAIVGFEDRPGVATALALSGSAAQSKIHEYPADADFFERVHIEAPTREEACDILADVIHEKALATFRGPTYRLCEVTFGTWHESGTVGGNAVKKGSPIRWEPAAVQAGRMELLLPDGATREMTWREAAQDPGWCKLDWVVADEVRGRLANASNVLDPTWEDPAGKIIPLDGYLDPYFQEVYLEAESIPLFSRLVKELTGDAVDGYVDQLEHEVWKYTVKDPNYGKAARRMYNVFRLTGRYHEAAYLRELFDDQVTVMYQVAALVRTLDEATDEGSQFDPEMVVGQTDQLIMSAIKALEGEAESTIVGHLLRLRDSLSDRGDQDTRQVDIEGVRAAAMTAVNDYFQQRMTSMPGIKSYLDEIATRES
ncbi:MAG: hypothetical protein M3432_08830 [Chloroflexota bacterium]|nr:hypothetical protein [Chloroflexota bacterium]